MTSRLPYHSPISLWSAPSEQGILGEARSFRQMDSPLRSIEEHLCIGESVSDIDVGQQIYWIRWVVFDLLAQLANEGAQVLDLFAAIGAPHGGKQLGVSDNAPGAAHQAMRMSYSLRVR